MAALRNAAAKVKDALTPGSHRAEDTAVARDTSYGSSVDPSFDPTPVGTGYGAKNVGVAGAPLGVEDTTLGTGVGTGLGTGVGTGVGTGIGGVGTEGYGAGVTPDVVAGSTVIADTHKVHSPPGVSVERTEPITTTERVTTATGNEAEVITTTQASVVEKERPGFVAPAVEGDICHRTTFTEVEDRPILQERVIREVEHREVEKEFVVETRPVGERFVGAQDVEVVGERTRIVAEAEGTKCPTVLPPEAR